MDRSAILKSLTLSFLPIIVYIVVESEYGPVPGMVSAFAWSLLEMAWIRYRERRIEKLLLIDIGLITTLGAIAIIFSDPFFFKLKPAIFELVFIIIIGLSIWGGIPIIQSMTKRQMSGTGLKLDFDNPQFRKMLIAMFILLTGHVVAVVWAAYYATSEVWGFVSGALLYIMMGTWVVGQLIPKFVKPVYWRLRYNSDEWFPVIDPGNGKVRFNAPRDLVHKNRDWLHPVVHINIFNKNDWWYLQQRAFTKELFPGYWDVSVGGHVRRGESIRQAGEREAREELGMELYLPEDPHFVYTIQLDNEKEYVNVYLISTHLKPIPNADELAGGRYWNPAILNAAFKKADFTPTLKTEFEFMYKNGFFDKWKGIKKKKRRK